MRISINFLNRHFFIIRDKVSLTFKKSQLVFLGRFPKQFLLHKPSPQTHYGSLPDLHHTPPDSISEIAVSNYGKLQHPASGTDTGRIITDAQYISFTRGLLDTDENPLYTYIYKHGQSIAGSALTDSHVSPY
jgi:hypothetical protein